MAGMKPKASVVRREGARTKRLERIVKGFANHRRIEILELLASHPDLCLGDISEKLEIEFKTASEHVRRLALSGLVAKRYKGRRVCLRLANGTRNILAFLGRLA
jgi:DNA-binding transcriptional ArsR family regulator